MKSEIYNQQFNNNNNNNKKTYKAGWLRGRDQLYSNLRKAI